MDEETHSKKNYIVGMLFVLLAAVFLVVLVSFSNTNSKLQVTLAYAQIFAVVGTLTTAIIMAYSTNISHRDNKETLNEMREQRKPLLKIDCDEKRSTDSKTRGFNYYALIVKNVGLGPAENVEIHQKSTNGQEEQIMKFSMLGKDEIKEICEPAHDVCYLKITSVIKPNDSGQLMLKIKTDIFSDSFWKVEWFTFEDPEDMGFSIEKISKEEYEKPFEKTKESK
jgi:hypothetical protein